MPPSEILATTLHQLNLEKRSAITFYEIMTLHLLRDIPREVRDQIYACVLASGFGCVSIRPAKIFSWGWSDGARVDIVPVDPKTYEKLTDEPAIRLNLLRTCSQIHLEARNILWRHNSLALAQASTLYSHSRLSDPRFSYRIESVHLRMDLLKRRFPPESIDSALKILGKWAREGSLRSLTLTLLPANESDRGMAALNSLLEFRRLGGPIQPNPLTSDIVYFEYLAILKEARSYLPEHLRRKIVFHTNWDALLVFQKREWVKIRGGLCPQLVIKEIHDNFGGEFWMDGKLCFKDHVEVERVFVVPPEGEKIVQLS